MASQTQTLEFTQTVNASPAAVYHAFTNATALSEWCCDGAQADPRIDGRLYMWWNAGYYTSGTFTALEPDRTVAFTWHGRGESGGTQVHVSMEAQNGGTSINLVHSGIGGDDAWAETAKEFRRGWESGLENLQSVLETGMDLRFYRRPMLGIVSGQEVNAEMAAELGVPVTAGIQVSDVVEGMGAQAAGLQKDDVIVSLGDQPVVSFQTLTDALDPHQAGDHVALVFFRGSEENRTTMELSGRPAPEVPPTAEGLAEALRAVHAQLDAELAEIFSGVSEKQAAYRPGSGEWSAKEILAHLITTERTAHLWISRLMLGLDLDNWASNEQPWVSAVLAAYPTVSELVVALKQHEAETAAILAALPDEFVARKGSYVRMGNTFLNGLPYHNRLHFGQIREALEAVRGE